MLGWLDGLRRWVGALAHPQGADTTEGAPGSQPPGVPSFRARPVRAALAFITRSQPVFLAAMAAVALLLYFGLGGALSSTIDDNTAFRPTVADLSPGGSVAVGMSSAMLDRELNIHGWKADDPWFYPTAFLDNMPAWQRGLRMGVLRFVTALQARQSADPDLARAAEALDYPPDRWWIGLDWPWVRTASASSYRDAVAAIRAYNARVAGGDAPLTRDAATLALLLDHLAAALDDGENTLMQHVSDDGAAPNERLGNDEVFYTVRGEAYATSLILTGLREDFEPLIRQRQLAARWAAMARSLDAVVALDPLVVTSGDPGSFLIKNHLMEQGFALQRTEQQIRALAAALRQAPATPQTAQTRRR